MGRVMKSCLTALALLASLPALAASPIDQTRPLDPRGSVQIENLKGRVEVRAWDRPEVKVTGTLGDGVERLVVDGDRRSLRIEVKYPSQSRNTEPTVLIVQVPVLADLEVETVAADIDVHGMASRELSLESVSGDVTATGAPGSGSIETVSGDVRATLNSRDLSVETVSGELVVQGRLNGEISLESVSGNIRLGNLGEKANKVSVSTVSGDMALRLALAESGHCAVESVSGNLRLRMPANLSASVSAESFSGKLRAPQAKIEREGFGPGSSFNTRYGSGKGTIRIETFSGDATLTFD